MKKLVAGISILAVLISISLVMPFPAGANKVEEVQPARELLVSYIDGARALKVQGELPKGISAQHSIHHNLDVVEVEDTNFEAVLTALRNDPTVRVVEPNILLYSTYTPNDPYYPQQWALPNTGMPEAWGIVNKYAQREVIVAVIDTGVETSHVDLQGRLTAGYNFVQGTTVVTDAHGHGTAVSGVIVAEANNGLGISGAVGLAPIKVMPLQAAGDNTMRLSDLILAVEYAIDHGADIINISFGSTQSSILMQEAMNKARAAGVAVVASAGNSGKNEYMYPASCDGVISVGAIGENGLVTSFSTRNDRVLVTAPGDNVYTTVKGDSYGPVDGTSFSAPLVSGALAMAKLINAELTPMEMTNLLISSSIDLGTPGRDNLYGYGSVDAAALLAAVDGLVSGVGTLAGTVCYGEAGNMLNALNEVNVSIDALGVDTQTVNGQFSFTQVPAGVYSLRFTKNAYATIEIQNVVLQVGDTAAVNVATALIGDVNLDGVINAADIVPLNRHALGIEVISNSLAILVADTNADGIVNAADIVPLNRNALGIELIQ